MAHAQIVQAVITRAGEAWLARVAKGEITTNGIQYFRIGEGGFQIVGSQKVPKDPSIFQTALEADTTPGLFAFQKTFLASQKTIEDTFILRLDVFLDFGEANDRGDGSNPRFMELGIFSTNVASPDVMVGYITFPEVIKNNTFQLSKIVKISF